MDFDIDPEIARKIEELTGGRFTFFSKAEVPIEEMERFYAIDPKDIPKDRAYGWLMFVQSYDGIIAFLDPTYPDPAIANSGPGIAKRHRGVRGSTTDYRLLNFGWAVSDAIIAGAGIIRGEPQLEYDVFWQDLRDYRKDVLGKGEPIRVILTRSGLDATTLQYPIFNSDRYQTIIFASEKAHKTTLEALENLPDTADRIKIEVAGKIDADIQKLPYILRQKYGVVLADWQGGGDIAGQAYQARAFDEDRKTISPIVIGSLTQDGRPRPTSVKTSFTPTTAPDIYNMRVRQFDDFVFQRGKTKYNH